MAKTVVLQGQTFTIPEPGDVGWGSLSQLIERLTINVSDLLEQGPLVNFPPLQRSVREVTGDLETLTEEDDVVLVNNATTNPVSLTLPDGATLSTGKVITIKDKKGAASSEIIIVFPVSPATIDGEALFRIDEDYGDLTLVFDGSSWSRIQSLEEDFEKGLLPLGSVIPFTSHLAGSFTPPASGQVKRGLMLCDGSVIPAGQRLSGTLPDLTDGRFLRGGVSSGGFGAATDLEHTHTFAHTHSTDSSLGSVDLSHSHTASSAGAKASWNSNPSTTGGSASFNRNVMNSDQNAHRHAYGVQYFEYYYTLGGISSGRVLSLAQHNSSGFVGWVNGNVVGSQNRASNTNAANSSTSRSQTLIEVFANTDNSTVSWSSSTVNTSFTNPSVNASTLNGTSQDEHSHGVRVDASLGSVDFSHTHTTASQNTSTTSASLASLEVTPKYFEVLYLMRVK